MNDSANLSTLRFKVDGMHCAEEVALLKRELGPIVGGEDRLAFDILSRKLSVVTPAADVTIETVTQAVARTGMRAEVWQEATSDKAEAGFWQQHRRGVMTAASGLFGLAGFLVHAGLAGEIWAALAAEGIGIAGGVPLVPMILYLAGITTGMWYVLPKAWRAALGLRPDMNLLMTVAVVGAVAIGEWFEAVTVAFLFSLSLLLESWSVGRARRAIAALMDLAPLTARIRDRDGNTVDVPPEEVSVGIAFIVRPAEKIPLDGSVVRGTSHVNQAPITGESVPVMKELGSAVYAGTINGDGTLEIECTKPSSDTTLAHIIHMVGEAQLRARRPSNGSRNLPASTPRWSWLWLR